MKKVITSALSALAVALFVPLKAYSTQLNVTIVGEGEVTLSSGESCNHTQASCQFTVDNTQELRLDSVLGDGSYVSSWSNGFDDSEVCASSGNPLFAPELNKIVHPAALVHKISTADFNGDGHLDVAIQDIGPPTFSTSLSNGDGTYTEANVLLERQSFFSDVKTADWDQDGDQDILMVDYDESVIYLYTNDGHGNFSKAKNLTISGINPYAIAIADINQDGELDLLISSFDTVNMQSSSLGGILNNISNSDVSWYTNDGQDNFIKYQHVTSRSGIYALDIGDSNNDGLLDVAVASPKVEGFYLYESKLGQASFDEQFLHSGSRAYNIAFGDFDNNGLLDITTSTTSGLVSYIMQESAGAFTSRKQVYQYTGYAYAQALDVADIDQDGDDDIISGVFSNTGDYAWIENKGNQYCLLDMQGKDSLELHVQFSQSSALVTATPAKSSTSNDNNSINSNTSSYSSNSDSGSSFSFLSLLFIVSLLIAKKLRKV